MVDALRECWRVLEPRGVLLDLRPVFAAKSVERVGRGEVRRIGTIDGAPRPSDTDASNAALQRVVDEGRFVHRQTLHFDLHSYWRTLDELNHYLTRSGRTLRLDTQDRGSPARVRARERMQLSVYIRSPIRVCTGAPRRS